MLIWGWKERRIVLAMRVGHDLYTEYLIVRTGWITVFFIPVIPYTKKPKWRAVTGRGKEQWLYVTPEVMALVPALRARAEADPYGKVPLLEDARLIG